MYTTPRVPSARLLSVLDATLLDDDAPEAQVRAFLERIQGAHVAAVCVQPAWVGMARDIIGVHGICVASVANFPLAEGGPDDAGEEALALVEAGADEIDVVVPIDTLDRDEGAMIRWTLEAVRAAAPGLTIKAILETGALGTPARIMRAAGAAVAGGADFLKTSTGRHPVGATPEAVEALLQVMQACPGRVGLKISGGVADIDAAVAYWCQTERAMGPQWCHKKRFRIGASSLLNTLL